MRHLNEIKKKPKVGRHYWVLSYSDPIFTLIKHHSQYIFNQILQMFPLDTTNAEKNI